MKCNDRFSCHCLFHVVKSMQTKRVIRFGFYWTISLMFMMVKMFIKSLDSCVIFAMICFILSFCTIIYDFIDILIVFYIIFTFCKAGQQES